MSYEMLILNCVLSSISVTLAIVSLIINRPQKKEDENRTLKERENINDSRNI